MAGRIIAQVLVMGAQVFGKAGMQAYRQAIQNAKAGGVTTAVRKGMPVDEARAILNIEAKATINAEQIEEIFQKYYNANNPGKDHLGSPYIQQKVETAKEVLLSELAPKEPEPEADSNLSLIHISEPTRPY
eukprot:TRINITY_DN5045_c0_g1_i2.p1 TRINITY_DN5045_c0_g1~~TRINITY_DN5045_c0_g1_i2.p1  ORF type:complete len:131 (+),score=22.49 TRINITY_DN5045_c0_g1_i2:198-590(+)